MDEVDRKTLNSFVLEAVEGNLEHTDTHNMSMISQAHSA